MSNKSICADSFWSAIPYQLSLTTFKRETNVFSIDDRIGDNTTICNLVWSRVSLNHRFLVYLSFGKLSIFEGSSVSHYVIYTIIHYCCIYLYITLENHRSNHIVHNMYIWCTAYSRFFCVSFFFFFYKKLKSGHAYKRRLPRDKNK